MTHKVTFKKIENNHNKIRDDIIEGHCHDLPEINKQFVMFAKPRDAGDIRIVNTSLVKSCTFFSDTQSYVLRTESGSIYEVILTV